MSYEFDPMDLDEEFIDDIYKEALTDEKHFNHPVEVLRPDIVKNRSGVVLLNPEVINKYSEYIDYMFGQTLSFHNTQSPYMTFNDGSINYFGKCWTNDYEVLIKFYAIGIELGTIYPFVLSKNGVIVTKKDALVIPTLDTGDPKFQDWFENVYKKQYKKRKNPFK